MSTRARVLGWIAIGGFVLIALPIVAEITLRFGPVDLGVLRDVLAASTGDDSRSYVLKPGAEVAFAGMQERLSEPVAWRINEQGIRSDALVGPASERFRVLVFGDSEAFGWAMPLAATFQRQMERIDARAEVINLAVPGYNAENIADYMETALPRFRGDLVIYMFHKNDFDPTLTLSPMLARSNLYLALRLAYSIIDYENVKAMRTSPEGLRYIDEQVTRMIATAKREQVALLVGYLHGAFDKHFPKLLRSRKRADFSGVKPWQPGFQLLGGLNVERARLITPKVDHHMSATSHELVAHELCQVIGRGIEGSCVPPRWRR